MTTFELLKEICEIYGPSGREKQIAEAIKALAEEMGYECRRDAMGNLICHKAGKGAKLMFSAHMDSLGMIAVFVDEKGFIRFGCVGGLSPYNMLASSVYFENGVKGTIQKDGDAKMDSLTSDKLFIDIGAKTREEALKLISIGDIAVYDTPIKQSSDGKMVFGAYLDDRCCCVSQLLAMKEVLESENDLYFVFSVQEELGLRGAKTAAFGIDPDYMFVCDVTHSDDFPKSLHVGSCKAGDGACIKVMDKSVICHPEMVKKLVELAKENNIPYALDVITAGGTDAGAVQTSLDGVPVCGASVACRYVHTPNEMCAISDVENCGKLMAAFAKASF